MDMLNSAHNPRFVLTGGPGFGKSSIIKHLKLLGLPAYPDAARELIHSGWIPPIRSEKPSGGAFLREVIQRRIRDHQESESLKIAFFDRGLPDSIGFSAFMGHGVPEEQLAEIKQYPYHPVVFITPVWPEIYTRDPERREDLGTAVRLHECIVEAYVNLGYRTLEIPRGTIQERSGWVMQEAGKLLGYKMIDNISLL